ncbi:hypothetical protein BDW59DRAFT_21910 [Aspergillus cavernicola]|uniref:Uncharacterized protein n=1 Tax=Aspergillus cavernicola TaxID=176166 RepID=A0ABR4HHK5_9EURO
MKASRISQLNPWNKLHPPLPRTPRQSQQLLNALTSSFRRELDRHHPTTPPSSDQSPSANNNNALNANIQTDELPHSSAHATDNHLRTILENPLFRVVPLRTAVSSELDKARWSKEPTVVFDEMVASGSATHSVVKNCLRWQLLLASTQTGEGFVKALRDSRAGSRIVSWWLASDMEVKISFFLDPELLSPLLKFMVAEGLHDTIFIWLKMFANCDLGSQNGQLPEVRARACFKKILYPFLKAEIDCGGGISSSLRCYLEACRILLSTGDGEPKLQMGNSLLPPGGYLCHIFTDNARDFTKDIPVDLYEQYTHLISVLGPRTFLEASVPLYHPTDPDAKPFVEFVRRLPLAWRESWKESKREQLMRASFDALRILVDAGESRDCVYLARFMQHQLEEKHEAETANKTGYRVSSEERDLLTSLDLALT